MWSPFQVLSTRATSVTGNRVKRAAIMRKIKEAEIRSREPKGMKQGTIYNNYGIVILVEIINKKH